MRLAGTSNKVTLQWYALSELSLKGKKKGKAEKTDTTSHFYKWKIVVGGRRLEGPTLKLADAAVSALFRHQFQSKLQPHGLAPLWPDWLTFWNNWWVITPSINRTRIRVGSWQHLPPKHEADRGQEQGPLQFVEWDITIGNIFIFSNESLGSGPDKESEYDRTSWHFEVGILGVDSLTAQSCYAHCSQIVADVSEIPFSLSLNLSNHRGFGNCWPTRTSGVVPARRPQPTNSTGQLDMLSPGNGWHLKRDASSKCVHRKCNGIIKVIPKKKIGNI